jgi:hypothetical protein
MGLFESKKEREARQRREDQNKLGTAEFVEHYSIDEETQTVRIRKGYRLVTFALDHGMSHAFPSETGYTVTVRPRRPDEVAEKYESYFVSPKVGGGGIRKWTIVEQ